MIIIFLKSVGSQNGEHHLFPGMIYIGRLASCFQLIRIKILCLQGNLRSGRRSLVYCFICLPQLHVIYPAIRTKVCKPWRIDGNHILLLERKRQRKLCFIHLLPVSLASGNHSHRNAVYKNDQFGTRSAGTERKNIIALCKSGQILYRYGQCILWLKICIPAVFPGSSVIITDCRIIKLIIRGLIKQSVKSQLPCLKFHILSILYQLKRLLDFLAVFLNLDQGQVFFRKSCFGRSSHSSAEKTVWNRNPDLQHSGRLYGNPIHQQRNGIKTHSRSILLRKPKKLPNSLQNRLIRRLHIKLYPCRHHACLSLHGHSL